MQQNKEYVWYSPKWDQIIVDTKESGFLFKNENGEFHVYYNINDPKRKPFEIAEFYLIGEL